MDTRTVKTVDELLTAAGADGIGDIVVHGEIRDVPPLALTAGQRLRGDPGAALVFRPGVDGVRVSRDNDVVGLRIEVDAARRAIANDTGVDDLGIIRVAGVTTVGQVEILAAGRAQSGHVEVADLDVIMADTRDRAERPTLLGVGVLPGAFTLWNQHVDATSVLTADLRGIRAGRTGAAVRGSGVFVFGAGRENGRIEASTLETGPVFTDGGIASVASGMIGGGVFVGYGARVRDVRTAGPVTTYGINDMVLDNWGEVDRWIAQAPLTSYGRSGVGMVNFGAIGVLSIQAPIETHGTGARGFNVYRLDETAAPTVGTAEFDRIVTHGDAAIGIQIGQPIGQLTIHNGIGTTGGAGDSLVRGRVVRLSAHALSIQAGGSVAAIDVGGELTTSGDSVAVVDMRGEVAAMSVAAGIRATGPGSDGIVIDGGAITLRDTSVRSRHGAGIRFIGDGRMDLYDVDVRGGAGALVVRR